jgi:hypothetical protein
LHTEIRRVPNLASEWHRDCHERRVTVHTFTFGVEAIMNLKRGSQLLAAGTYSDPGHVMGVEPMNRTAAPTARNLRIPARLSGRYRRLATRTSVDGRDSWMNWSLWSVPGGIDVGLVQASVRPDGTARIDYVLTHSESGREPARGALAAVIESLSLEWGEREVRATVDARNPRSIALLANLKLL